MTWPMNFSQQRRQHSHSGGHTVGTQRTLLPCVTRAQSNVWLRGRCSLRAWGWEKMREIGEGRRKCREGGRWGEEGKGGRVARRKREGRGGREGEREVKEGKGGREGRREGGRDSLEGGREGRWEGEVPMRRCLIPHRTLASDLLLDRVQQSCAQGQALVHGKYNSPRSVT